MPKLKLLFLLPVIALAFTGCVSQEEIDNATSEQLPQTPDQWVSQGNPEDVEVGWIHTFNDKELTTLVKQAQVNNKNLQAAAANIKRSRAEAEKAGAALFPQINLGADGGRSGNDTTSVGNYSMGLQITWEIDVWGRISAGQEAARANAQAVEADFKYAQESLAAATTKAYFLCIVSHLQQRLSEEQVKILTETQRIVQVRLDNGMGTRKDLALANSDLAVAKEQLEKSKGAKRDAIRALEVLLGQYPAAQLEVRTDLPAIPNNPPAGVPSEILERRPDMVSAERKVAAAFNALHQAKVAQLPKIGITGNLGTASTVLSGLVNPANLAWQAGMNLLAPIFDGGQRRADVKIATAGQEQSLALYGQTALEAFQEVEGLLDLGGVLRKRHDLLEIAVDEAEEAYRIANLQYNEGETDLLDVLTIQQRYIRERSNLIALEGLMLEQRVNLFLALGGDWDVPTIETSTSE